MSRLQIASLVAPRRTFVSGGPHGYSPRWELVSFAWRQARATLVPPGLLRRVHRELKNSAQEVEVVPKPMRPQLFGNAEALQELAPEDRRLIESIHGDACGLVATCDRLSVIGVIDVVTRAFPAARLLIVTKHPSQAARLCKQLRRSLGIDAAVHARAPRMPANRCLVSSLTALLHRSGRWDRDILIFVDAMDALTKDGTFGVLTSWQGWRVLGLAPLQKLLELTPYESLYLESLFGPVVQIVGSAAEQVRVALLPKPHLAVAERCDSDRGLASALERKRALIWRDQTRNRWLAELACAIQQRGLAALPSASTFPTSRPSSDCSLHRIALLVESPEHGDLLRSYLPTWPVYDRHAVTGDQNSGASLPAIVTAAFAHQHSADADVWIRADRGELGVDLLDLRPTRLRERESPTLLVDFAEDGSLTSGERLRSYLLRGWRLIQGLEHFVERRSAGPPVPVDQLPVRNWYREQLQHGAQDLSELISVG